MSWKMRELRFVESNIGKMSHAKIAAALGKNPKTIHYCVKHLLGKTSVKKSNCYTAAEDNFIRQNYLSMTDSEIAEKMGRSREGIQRRRMVLNLKKYEREKIKIKQNKIKKPQIRQIRQEGDVWERVVNNENGSDYRYKRIKIGGKVLSYHRHIWELNNPKLKKNEIIRFHNGDTMDCRIENLYLVTRGKLIKDNQNQKTAWVTRKRSKNDLYTRILNGHAGYE